MQTTYIHKYVCQANQNTYVKLSKVSRTPIVLQKSKVTEENMLACEKTKDSGMR